MPSKSFETWQTVRAKALNEIVAAHQTVGGTGRGRRFATQQLNHAYAVLLSSQFQGNCRDLHSECVDFLAAQASPAALLPVIHAEFSSARKLDKGNPSPGNIGADFNRFGFRLWDQVCQLDSLNAVRKADLELLNEWRNAIAHQDFTGPLGGIATLHLSHVKKWRRACDSLASTLNNLIRQQLKTLTGSYPW